MRNLLLLSLLIYGTQAMAVDVAPATEKTVPAVKQHKHKKDCIEKEGQPCHLHKPVRVTKPVVEAKELKSAQMKVDKVAAPNEVKPVASEAVKSVVDAPKVVSDITPAAVPVAVVAAQAEVSTERALALAKQNNCLACHAIDRKIVGPAWRDVANKYRGDAGAEARLINKIAKGGSGVWGSMAMPAHPHISEADRTTLAKFVLNLH